MTGVTEEGGRSVERDPAVNVTASVEGLKRENGLTAGLPGLHKETMSPKQMCKQKNPAQVRDDSFVKIWRWAKPHRGGAAAPCSLL